MWNGFSRPVGQDSEAVVLLPWPPELVASFLKRGAILVSELETPIRSLSGPQLALGRRCHQLLNLHPVAHALFRSSADEKQSPIEQPL